MIELTNTSILLICVCVELWLFFIYFFLSNHFVVLTFPFPARMCVEYLFIRHERLFIFLKKNFLLSFCSAFSWLMKCFLCVCMCVRPFNYCHWSQHIASYAPKTNEMIENRIFDLLSKFNWARAQEKRERRRREAAEHVLNVSAFTTTTRKSSEFLIMPINFRCYLIRQ